MKKRILFLLFAFLLAITVVFSGCRGKKAGATSSAASFLNGSSATESELFSSNGTDSETKLSSLETQSLFNAQKGKSTGSSSGSTSSKVTSKAASKSTGTANAGNLDKDGDGWTDGWN